VQTRQFPGQPDLLEQLDLKEYQSMLLVASPRSKTYLHPELLAMAMLFKLTATYMSGTK
jgi:hypothetical protein